MRTFYTLHHLVWLVASLLWVPSTTCFVLFPANEVRRSRVSSLSTATGDDDATATTTASYLATCIPGLAHILAEELAEIHPDIADISQSGNAAVTFVATREASLHALCWVRTAHRLLELVAASSDYLCDRKDLSHFMAQEVNVKELVGDGQGGLLTVSVKAILNSPRLLPQDLSHSHFTALGIKNALCDIVRELRDDRPDVDIDNPDLPLVAMLRGTNNVEGGGATLSLYRSLHPPGSLHKRGYRQGSAIHKASMKESLAAGLLREAGWHRKLLEAKKDGRPLRLIDPMAGSGSFLLEAAMMAADIAPGLMRIRCGVPDHNLPPVTRWKSEEDVEEMWKQVLLDAAQRAKHGLRTLREDPSRVALYANDIHPGALDIMESSLSAAGLLDLVKITNLDCYDLKIDQKEEKDDENAVIEEPYFVVTNPPWGVRLTDDIAESWEGLRHFLRDVCPTNTEAWVLSGDKAATLSLKLRRDRMMPLQTGDQHLRWIQYTIGGARAISKPPREKRNGETSISQDKARQYDGAPSGESSKKAASYKKAPARNVVTKVGKKIENDSWD